MQRNKKGGQLTGSLADLKRLRQQAETASQPAKPPVAKRAARKRAPFQMPGSGPKGASEVTTAAGGSGTPVRQAGTKGVGEAGPESSLLNEEDRKLFRSAVRYVDRIRDPGRLLLKPVADAPASILKERRMRAAGIERSKPAKKSAVGPPQDKGTPAGPASDPAAQGKRRRGKRPSTPLSDSYAPTSADQDDSSHLKAGHGPDVLRDLRRGKWPIGASLDLHGSTLDDARERFERFIGSCLTHDVKCVHIVHGKGHGSNDGTPVLKTTVRRWLAQMPEVIAYIECAEAEGGAGAVQVLLK